MNDASRAPDTVAASAASGISPPGPLAVIDVGVYAARMQISQLRPDGELETLEEVSQPVPLSADLYRGGGNLSAANTNLVGRILADFAQLMRECGVASYKAVTTGAVSEAANREIFLDRARQISGVALEALEEPEEIRCVFLAVQELLRGRYSLGGRNAVMVVIGPDATQVLFLVNGHLAANETVRLGTLRLKEELGGPVSAVRLREVLDPFVAAVVNGIARMSGPTRPDPFIAVGSVVRGLASLGGPRVSRQRVTVISRPRFRQLCKLIAGRSVLQLAGRYRLTDAVANSLEPCCNLLEHFFDITAADRLLVPMVSTRDALLRDLVRRHRGQPDPFPAEIVSAACHCGEKYSYDAAHARTVADLALQLFDGARDLHGLGERDRLLLELAGILHDIGFFVSSRQHHKHSYYLVRNTELPGISPAERELLALIARYHRRASPRPSHLEYLALPPERQVRVSKLAALLRVADALDRSHTQKVRRVLVELDEDRLLLRAPDAHDLTFEELGLGTKADLFTELFGIKVVLAAG
jgi:exopolyphosphatase/guanosine-5'-triphosphate,3'-diphosphate pyrophosphatase